MVSEKLLPCPMCANPMEDRGYGAMHTDGAKCILATYAFDDVAAWNTRAPADCKLADGDGKDCVLLNDHEGGCLSYNPKEVGVRLMSALGHVENCRAHGRITDAGFAAIRSALLIADRELSRLRAPADLRSALEAETIERAARAMCVHDGLDPDEHIIGGQATGFEDYGPLWQAEQRSEGQLGITDYAGLARAALAPTKEPAA